MTDEVMGAPSVGEQVDSVNQQPEATTGSDDVAALRRKLEHV
jgi:hypothetical protein